MERYLFFNSTTDDRRKYQAQHFAEYFGSVLSTGLLHTDNMPGMVASVEPGTLNTIVSPGKAIMRGHLYENTTDLTLTHDIPEPDLDRIDRIVLRLNLNNAVRDIKLHVKTGTPSNSPVAPELQRDEFIHEISIAQIKINANTVQLTPSNLIDERLDEELCGLVYSLISIPTDQLQNFINAKRIELGDTTDIALNEFLQAVLLAETQLQEDVENWEGILESDLNDWRQEWTNWFSDIQVQSPAMGGMTIHVSNSTPQTPTLHDIWIDTND